MCTCGIFSVSIPQTGKKIRFQFLQPKIVQFVLEYFSSPYLTDLFQLGNVFQTFPPSPTLTAQSTNSTPSTHPFNLFFLQKWSSFIYICVYIFSTAAFLLEIFSCNILSGLQVSKRNIFRIYRSLFKHMNQSIHRLLIIFSLQLKNNIQIIHC